MAPPSTPSRVGARRAGCSCPREGPHTSFSLGEVKGGAACRWRTSSGAGELKSGPASDASAMAGPADALAGCERARIRSALQVARLLLGVCGAAHPVVVALGLPSAGRCSLCRWPGRHAVFYAAIRSGASERLRDLRDHRACRASVAVATLAGRSRRVPRCHDGGADVRLVFIFTRAPGAADGALALRAVRRHGADGLAQPARLPTRASSSCTSSSSRSSCRRSRCWPASIGQLRDASSSARRPTCARRWRATRRWPARRAHRPGQTAATWHALIEAERRRSEAQQCALPRGARHRPLQAHQRQPRPPDRRLRAQGLRRRSAGRRSARGRRAGALGARSSC